MNEKQELINNIIIIHKMRWQMFSFFNPVLCKNLWYYKQIMNEQVFIVAHFNLIKNVV